jgi:diacylglycerol kinase (ATP)
MTSSPNENRLLRFLRSRGRAFRYAFAGWWYVIRTQRNAWIHATVSIVVMALSLWLRVTRRDWAIIILTIAMVWIAEFLNTALEAVVDLASHNEHHELARVGKDVGAAAVLIAALAAVVVGLLVLGPPLWVKIMGMIK